MIQKEFKFYKPCELLRPYVRYYWVFKSDQMLNTYTFPIGCPQIIFHKQNPLYIPELDTTQSKLTISGQVNFSSHLYADGNIEMIVVVFYPHTINMFLNSPASLFYNQEISGYDIEDRALNELAERVFECADNSVCVNRIEEWLLGRLASNFSHADYGIKRIHAAIKDIFIYPQSSVMALSSTCCLSKKQFEREFNSLVGMNPKEYIRIVRFQKALSLFQQNRDNINHAQIAYASGYADQAHYIREFKRLSGYTPKTLLKISEPYSDLFTTPV